MASSAQFRCAPMAVAPKIGGRTKHEDIASTFSENLKLPLLPCR